MKTTLEIPDRIFRRAKSVAAQRGIALRVFVTEAVEEKLAATTQKQQKQWVGLAGGLKHLREETARVNGIMDSEFEQIEPEDIDHDVASLLKKEMRRTGEPLKVTVNALLRSGLQQAAAPAKPKPFRVKARDIGLPKEWTSGCVSELLEMLEGPMHK